MEAVIAIVGFLGAGKTTLLKQLLAHYQAANWQPFIILNDYENADIDAQQFTHTIEPNWIKALNGSCICCSGISELRESVNRIPERPRGITLIEANGTTDACSLMGFLGVGIDKRFLPPVQVSVVDVKNWQRRGQHNELEANQIQVSSVVVLTHTQHCDAARLEEVITHIKSLNGMASVVLAKDLDINALPQLTPSENKAKAFDHAKAHWSSCSIDLPALPDQGAITKLCNLIPSSILRVKGFTRIGNDTSYTYFERLPDLTVHVRPFKGQPNIAPKLLTVGPGSNAATLQTLLDHVI